MSRYAYGNKYGGLKTLYGWHISDLKIYDKPKELSEFRKCGFNQDCEKWEDLHSIGIGGSDIACLYPPQPKEEDYILKRPPQSWQYVEEVE